MAYFLAILKVLGWIVGYFIVLVLLLAALVIWVPVRYQVTVQNQFSFLYSFRFSWLGRFVTVKKDKFSSEIWLRVLGIPLRRLDGGGKEEEEEEERKERRLPKREKQQDTPVDQKKSERPAKRTEPAKSRKEKKNDKKNDKKGFSFDWLSTIIDFIRDTDNKTGFRAAFLELKDLLRYLAPRSLLGNAVIGTGDPAATGMLFGVISLFPVVYQKDVTIRPDFESEEMVFQVNGEMRGRVTVWHFICLVIRVYRDERLRKLWDNFNQMRDTLSTD